MYKFHFFTIKIRSRSRSTIFEMKPFKGKCQNLTKKPLFTFMIFAKVLPV